MARSVLGIYWDRDGESISLKEWLAKRNDRGYCLVKRQMVAGLLVSTVWLGVEGARFETMVFNGTQPLMEVSCRYEELREAEEGHREAVDALSGARRLG